MKNATSSNRSSIRAILETLFILAILIAIGAMITSQLHAQAPLPAATDPQLTPGFHQAENVAQAVAPNIFTQPVVHTIESIVIIMALVSRILLKYCPGLQTPSPGGAAAKVVAVLNHTGGVITAVAFACFMSLPLALGGCNNPTVQALKPTAISLALPAGYEAAKLALQRWPAKAPAIISDVRALLTDVLGTGQPIAPAQLTAWENSEAAKLGLTASDVQTLDDLLQTGVVALQAQYGRDVKAGLGVTATAVLTNFDAGLAQATAGPSAMITRPSQITDFGRGYFI